jgi:hypothetical protein
MWLAGGTDRSKPISKDKWNRGSTSDVAFVALPGIIARHVQKGTLMLIPDDIAVLYNTNITQAWKTPVSSKLKVRPPYFS